MLEDYHIRYDVSELFVWIIEKVAPESSFDSKTENIEEVIKIACICCTHSWDMYYICKNAEDRVFIF